MSRDQQHDLKMKLLTFGDGGVGKTCLLWRFAYDKFSDSTLPTIGVDYQIKYLELDDKRRVKVQIWDTAGQERFRTITTSYYKGAQGILLVYDVTDRNSFQSVRTWMEQIKEHCEVNVNTVLVGNKCDLEDKRLVKFEEGRALAEEYEINFYETSAKKNVNVEKAFLDLATAVKNRLLADEGNNDQFPIDLIKLTADKSSSTCSC
eukprot:CAMPEP_0174981362 /NCGR_PEP_ID=MMETSP0004_2-20121128/15846_1 /TAXON_ID=420556 /ORGANISM="Ochromonas sp., Strain CCMP1393" /LENGTH=204 /DNA_ID=CAMNT_0016233095 /DNA_START=44 /DNA_END=658 /DNA_ORIENTATION=+